VRVTTGRDDDALTWSGDDDPTLDVGAAPLPATTDAAPPTTDAAPPALPDGFTALGKGSDEVGRVDSEGEVTHPADRRPMGNGMLIALGVFGGVYLLYAIGWLIGGLRLQGGAAYLVTDVMFQGSLWLAVLAPVLWFATVYLLTRSARAWVRIVWLLGGAALLVPWPFIMTGAVGS
jgi:hypothetical protein